MSENVLPYSLNMLIAYLIENFTSSTYAGILKTLITAQRNLGIIKPWSKSNSGQYWTYEITGRFIVQMTKSFKHIVKCNNCSYKYGHYIHM